MLTRLIKIEPSEARAVVWSFLYFFALLSSYYILRPVREEMGIQGGIANLPWLFTATFCVMLAAVPVFGWLSARLPRRTLLPLIYGFFSANLVIFFAAFQFEDLHTHTAQAFFVWLSVFNLFDVSVFWSFMVDLYSAEQGKRLFGLIAAGGTAGAVAGPANVDHGVVSWHETCFSPGSNELRTQTLDFRRGVLGRAACRVRVARFVARPYLIR